MPHYGILRDYKFEDAEDIRGAEVYGVNDEKLGAIADVIFDHSTGEIRYVVVDSGGWLSSKKFLVPISRIEPYGKREDKFYAELDNERIQMLPEFNAETLKSEQSWSDYTKKYQEHWTTIADVMLNEKTNRIITPPMDQVEGAPRHLTEEEKRSLERDFTPEKLGKREEYFGVAANRDDVTLRPKKPSIAGKQDVLMQEQESSTKETVSPDQSLEGSRVTDREALQEPGIYRLDTVPEAEKKSDMNEPLNAHYGRRWISFQQKLRAGRDKVVADCPLCGTQDKAA